MLCSRRLDISDEFKQVISTLKGHDDKVSNIVTVLVMHMVLAGVMPMLLLQHAVAPSLVVSFVMLHRCLLLVALMVLARFQPYCLDFNHAWWSCTDGCTFFACAHGCTAVRMSVLPCGCLYCQCQVRIILNKSDQVDQQQLMRVYGALMWSLGKVFKSPEVCKVGRPGSLSWWCVCVDRWTACVHMHAH